MLLSSLTQAQNLTLLSSIDYQELHGTELNDVWGYVDELGNEYALVGTQDGVSIVDLSDPENPQEVFWVEQQNSIWRDLHVYQDKAYVTTEAEDGLLIIDLAPLPSGVITETDNYFGEPGNTWETAHNLWIDEAGFCYIFGSNRGEGGVIIYDLNTDPWEPNEVGIFDSWYVHDGFVRNDTMYLAHIYEGTFSIVDVSDKSAPELIATQSTPSNFAHNIWPSDDGKYVFTTDEVSNGYLTAFDIENLEAIQEIDRIKVDPEDRIVPHNAHFFNDYLITSYYAAGVTIHDVSNPQNMVEVGRFDTYPGTSTTTDGCWGAYPYLPSGLVLATDSENGFFILEPNYVQAARIEGTITDAVTGNPIQGVFLEIEGHDQISYSAINGEYKNGIAVSEERNIFIYKYGYEEKEITVDFQNGETVVRDVQLNPIPSFPFVVQVQDENETPILDAQVRIVFDDSIELNRQTNGLGQAEYDLFYESEYSIFIGKWKYRTVCLDQFIDSDLGEITVTLTDGYYDDFTFDFGWSTFGNAELGQWERGVPIGAETAGTFANPNVDGSIDCSDYAYVTGNSADPFVNVSEGEVNLVSPIFDATILEDPFIYYERWFFNFYGPEFPNDTLRIFLNNGSTTVEIDHQGFEASAMSQWVPKSIRVQDFLTPTSTMRLRVSTSDEYETRNFVHAGFDHFQITEGSILEIENSSIISSHAYPNPFDDHLNITGISQNNAIILRSADGKIVFQTIAKDNAMTFSTLHLPRGIYFLHTNSTVIKLIKN